MTSKVPNGSEALKDLLASPHPQKWTHPKKKIADDFERKEKLGEKKNFPAGIRCKKTAPVG